jgi:TonB-dependent receptor
MKKIIQTNLAIFVIILQSCFVFSQEQQIRGVITDVSGEPLPQASVAEKGTKNGTQTDFNGKFSIKVTSKDAILVVSYLGFKTLEVPVNSQTNLKIKLEDSAEQLGAIVIGIKASQLRATAIKRRATSVVEAISPQDIGNFSDENIGDALRRVPGVQIQEDQSGGQDGGSRVSIRGIGPAFVQVTVNGRQPLSAGVEGISRFRQFNVDVIPPEILQGATVYKTSEAGLIEPGLGGLVNFQTLRPLSASYKNDSNIFGAINVRGESDTQHDSFLSLTPRVSAILGVKTKDEKFGAYVSFLTSQAERARDQVFSRITSRDLKEDTNGNGVWDGAAGGDTEYLGVITPNNVTNNPIREEQKRLAMSTALEWKPTEYLHVVADVQFSRLETYSNRALIRPNNGTNAVTGVISPNKVFAPGNLTIVDNFLQGYNTAGAFNSANGDLAEGANMLYQTTWYDNLNDTWIGGLNATWEKNGWKIAADYSLSKLDFNQILEVGGRSAAAGQPFNNGPFLFDGSDYPRFELGQDAQSSWISSIVNNDLAAPIVQWNRYVGASNDAFKIDISKELSDNVSIDFGTRLATNDFFVAAVQRNGGPLSDYLAASNGGTVPTVSANDAFGGNITNFLPGNNYGLMDSWPRANISNYENTYSDFFNYKPGSHPLFGNGVDIFDAENIVNQSISDGTDEGWRLQNGPLFQFQENTFALYGQINVKTKIGNVPVSGNLGFRGVRTEYTGKAFTTITLNDPEAENGGPINLGRVKSEVNDAQWQVLPSLNLKFALNKNLNYRFSLVKTLSRPEYNELTPGGTLSAMNTLNSQFDGTNGSVSLPNTELKPYTTWQIDNTLEWYNKYGGAVVFSVFYKGISDYVGTLVQSQVSFDQVLEDGGFDTTTMVDAGVLDDFQNQTYDVSQPTNIGNAKVFGFEAGFNQPLDIISDALKNFGVQANYNFITASFDNDEINADDAFPGTSKHNFNTVAYFENEKFGLRAAYNIRSNFLRTLSGQGLTALPEYTEGRGQLDLRGNYEITENMQFSIAAQNVTGTDQRAFFRNNPAESFQLISGEPIVTLGLRYGF